MVSNMDQFYKSEAEQSVIGGILLNSTTDNALIALEMLLPSDFYLRVNKKIWQAICELSSAGNPIDLITLFDYLERQGPDSDITFSYLGDIAKNTPSQANIHVYAKIVKDHSKLRAARDHIFTASEALHDRTLDPSARINASLSVLSKIGEDSTERTGKTIADCTQGLLARMQTAFMSGTNITGLSTGFEHLDSVLSGMQPADLIIVAARPSMGKSTFTFNIAENVAYVQKKHVMVFSMEMPAEAILQKAIASLAGVPLEDIRNGQILRNDNNAAKMSETIAFMNDFSNYLYIDDEASLHISQIQARAKRRDMAVKNDGGLALVVVDYLQQAKAEGDNDTGITTAISNGLKALAKTLGCPVIAVSQLNRALTGKPKLVNLRSSGAIEQDADVVIFLHDPDYQDEDSKRTAESLTQAIVAKQRMGPLGNIFLQPELHLSRFTTTTRIPQPKALEQKQKQHRRYDE